MKKLLALATLVASTTSFAEVSATATFTSDYVWRGFTQTNHDSAIQGSLDYSHASGLSLGVWTSSLNDEKGVGTAGDLGQEVDLYASYSYEINKDHAVTVSATNYTYTRDANANFGEYAVSYENPYLDLFIARYDELNGNEEGAATFIEVSKDLVISEKEQLGLHLSYGQMSMDDEEEYGSTGYGTYKIAVSKSNDQWTAELFHTNVVGFETGTAGNKDSFEESEQLSSVGFALSTSL